MLLQASLRELLDLVGDCMGLDEDKCSILWNRLVQLGKLHTLRKAGISIHIFESIESGAHLLPLDLDLWIHRPSTDGPRRDALRKHCSAELVLCNRHAEPIVPLGQCLEGRCGCV